MPPKKQISAKNWFLTFPQCDTKKDVAAERIDAKFRHDWATLGLRGYCIAQEQHKDGADHLHILLCFNERFRTTSSSSFDFIGGKHGNYQPARDQNSVLHYIEKADQSPVRYGECSKSRKDSAKTSRLDQAARDLKKGKKLDEVAEEDPGIFLQNKRKMEDYCSYLARKKLRTDLKPRPSYWEHDYGEGITTEARQLLSIHTIATYCDIITWINANMCDERRFKQPALWIHGPTNSYKTSLALKLGEYYSIYWMPITEEFYDDYTDEDYDLCVLDEFKGQHTMQFLNLFINGGPMTIRKKGSQYLKLKKMPLIIISNFTPEEAYNKASQGPGFEAFLKRLEIVSLIEPILLDHIRPVYVAEESLAQPLEDDISTEEDEPVRGFIPLLPFNFDSDLTYNYRRSFVKYCKPLILRHNHKRVYDYSLLCYE